MSDARMSAREALAVVHAARRPSDIVITTMSPARDWMLMPPSALDLVFVPSAMGHATSIGLGLALAQPARQVVVCNGDGSMLMNLGSLASIAEAAPANLIVLVFANGSYEVTGGQQVPGFSPGRRVDFAAVARGCGIERAFSFSNISSWNAAAPGVLRGRGPALVQLDVAPVVGVPGPKSPGPAGPRARAFMDALRAG